MSDRRRLVESILVVSAMVLASVALYHSYKKPPQVVIAESDGGRKYGNAYPYVDLSGAQTVLANPPLGHAKGGTDVTSPGTSGNVLTSSAGNWVSAPNTGGSGAFACSSLNACTGGQLPFSGISDGVHNSLLATSNAGAVEWETVTPGGDITLSSPITGTAIPFEVIAWLGIPLSGAAPGNAQAYVYNLGGNNWVPTSVQVMPVTSGINHNSGTLVPTSYGTAMASLTLTVPSLLGLGATIDCHAAIEWDLNVASSGSHTMSWGISQDSLAAPTTSRALQSAITSIVGGSMVESYPGTSAGAHTYRILAQDPTTGSGVSNALRSDLLCIQH